MENVKKGNQLAIFIGNTSQEVTITDISAVQTPTISGTLIKYLIPGYGETADYYVPDNTMLTTQIEERRGRSGMPKEFVYTQGNHFKWDKYGEDVEPQKKIANNFVLQFDKFRKEGRGLYISSNTKGSGKTMLACCIANEILKRNKFNNLSVKYTSITEYIELVSRRSEESKEILDSLLDASLLIVDDIGAVNDEKGWMSNAIFRLVNRRHENLLPTIYTSNLEISELKCGERTSSRIYEDTYPIMMPEVSIRKIKADESKQKFLSEIFAMESKESVF